MIELKLRTNRYDRAPEHLKAKVMESLKRHFESHPAAKNINIPIVVSFTMRSKTAGKCYVTFVKGSRRITSAKVEFNHIMLRENPDKFIERTVPHEAAHILEFASTGRMDGHAEGWKKVMTELGATDIKKYHSYDTTNIKRRVVARKHKYGCPCGKEFLLTTILHNRILAGQGRICGSCRREIKHIK